MSVPSNSSILSVPSNSLIFERTWYGFSIFLYSRIILTIECSVSAKQEIKIIFFKPSKGWFIGKKVKSCLPLEALTPRFVYWTLATLRLASFHPNRFFGPPGFTERGSFMSHRMVASFSKSETIHHTKFIFRMVINLKIRKNNI